MSFTYEYPRPAVTVDLVVFGRPSKPDNRLHLLLIQRKHPPFQGCWALPGGFVDENEDLETAARRELKEETGVEVSGLLQLGAFGAPGRDPRGHTVSVAYMAVVDCADVHPKSGDDAASVTWMSTWDVITTLMKNKEVAFDHADIINRGLGTHFEMYGTFLSPGGEEHGNAQVWHNIPK